MAKTYNEIDIKSIKNVRKDGQIVEEVRYQTYTYDENDRLVKQSEIKKAYYPKNERSLSLKAKKYRDDLYMKEYGPQRRKVFDKNTLTPPRGALFKTKLQLFVVVMRGKNKTAFFFPHRGGSNLIEATGRITETGMLKRMLGKEYSAFILLLREWSTSRNPSEANRLRIYNGWFYQQSYVTPDNTEERFTALRRKEFFGAYDRGRGLSTTDFLKRPVGKKARDRKAEIEKQGKIPISDENKIRKRGGKVL